MVKVRRNPRKCWQ